jgi:hypothetical protein
LRSAFRLSAVGFTVALLLPAIFWAGNAIREVQNLQQIAPIAILSLADVPPVPSTAGRDFTKHPITRQRRLVSASAVARPRAPLVGASHVGRPHSNDGLSGATLDTPGEAAPVSLSLPGLQAAVPVSIGTPAIGGSIVNELAPLGRQAELAFGGESRATFEAPAEVPPVSLSLPALRSAVPLSIDTLAIADPGADDLALLGARGQLRDVQTQSDTTGGPAGQTDAVKPASYPIIPVPGVPISSFPVVLFPNQSYFGAGPTGQGFQYMMDLQPIVPFSISENWNLIVHMILPVVYQNNVVPGAGDQFGLGDAIFDFFFSPKEPTKEGIFWGVGPTLLAPTGTSPLLSAQTWGAGLDGVVLAQIHQKSGVLTVGALASQTWRVAGPAPINLFFTQPFIDYTFPSTFTIALWSQSAYDWNQRQWTVPIIFTIGKLFKFGSQLVAIGLDTTFYPVGPKGIPTWGIGPTFVLLFPEKH